MKDHTGVQPALSSQYVVIDYEGTGNKTGVPEGVVEIAAVAICQARIVDQIEFRLNPGVGIPAHISRIHGIYDRDVIGAPSLNEVRPKLVSFLNGMILVAHNAPIERRMLEHTLPELRIMALLDSLRLSRKLFPREKGHGLDDLIRRFSLANQLADICPSSGRHSALFDAQATALAFLNLLDELGPDCPLQKVISLCGIDTTLAISAGGETQLPLFE